MSLPVNVAEYEALAAERLEAGLLGYYAGGAADERTLRDNVEAFARHRLLPRVLVDVGAVDTRTTVLGAEVAFPLLVAPTALHGMCHADAEPGMARAAADAGTVFCLSSLATTRPSDVVTEGRRWFQLYVLKDRAVSNALLEEAVDSGFEPIVLTVDAPRAGRRERDRRTGFAVPADVDMPAVREAVGSPTCPTPAEFFELVDPTLTWRDLERLVDESPIPVLLKGVHAADDARRAVDHGAAGVIVSNHGGRQLDGVPAAIDMLPAVAAEIGEDALVLMDGGIRRGTDVVVALALGAQAVLVGRPMLWGLSVDGAAGAAHVLELLREEFQLALTLLGAPTPAQVGPQHLFPVT
ncbi:MAG: alpha-hydroxy-acid oxidizing protein [Solirubrobacteraceae bacterium]|nr:alpha-hydroxy-acid oxidizing protein [Solirubrobacteraceae bacterium]